MTSSPRRLDRAPPVAAVLALLVLPPGGAAQVHPGRLATRAACVQALGSWTAADRSDPFPFHLRPAVSALLAPGADPAPGRTDVGAGGHVERDVLRAGESVPSDVGYDYPGPTVRPDDGGGTVSLTIRERTGPVALVADATVDERIDVPVAQLALRLGSVLVSAGREGLWPGGGCSSGLVLSGRGRAEGVGVDTHWLAVPLIGTVSLSAFLGRLKEGSTDNRRPFFLAHRLVWALGDAVRLGVTRAAIFGGEATSVPVTFRTVALMLLGTTTLEEKDSDFENQVASVDLSWRIPLGASALRLHLEHAADDGGLAFARSPGVRVGGELVTSSETGVVVVGAELAWIAPRNRGHPEWYRHGALAWGWTDRGVLLGHDLGGEGWGLRLDGFRSSGEDDLAAEVLLTRRGGENLLAPRADGWGIEARSEGRRVLGAWGGGRVLAAWGIEGGVAGGHDYLAARLSALYRF